MRKPASSKSKSSLRKPTMSAVEAGVINATPDCLGGLVVGQSLGELKDL